VNEARTTLELSTCYEAALELSYRLTSWSKKLDHDERRFVVCPGGGPGIMEAANRGASDAKGLNIGLTISIPNDEFAGLGSFQMVHQAREALRLR
jgi:predicted Rossmann-fold nucleotide-binding protein